MTFLIGFSFVIALAVYTVMLWLISKRISKEFMTALIALLVVGDGILLALWYYIGKDFVEVLREFELGIGAAFASAAFGRALFFWLQDRD